jgi:hypothetical protein
VRSSFSILLSLAVLTAFAEAPFLHTHRHAATERHSGPLFHLHLQSAHDVGTTREFRGLDPNEDAQYQNWFSATPTHSGSIAMAGPEESFILPNPEQSGWAVEVPLRTGHDPPQLTSKHPRAPPA